MNMSRNAVSSLDMGRNESPTWKCSPSPVHHTTLAGNESGSEIPSALKMRAMRTSICWPRAGSASRSAHSPPRDRFVVLPRAMTPALVRRVTSVPMAYRGCSRSVVTRATSIGASPRSLGKFSGDVCVPIPEASPGAEVEERPGFVGVELSLGCLRRLELRTKPAEIEHRDLLVECHPRPGGLPLEPGQPWLGRLVEQPVESPGQPGLEHHPVADLIGDHGVALVMPVQRPRAAQRHPGQQSGEAGATPPPELFVQPRVMPCGPLDLAKGGRARVGVSDRDGTEQPRRQGPERQDPR